VILVTWITDLGDRKPNGVFYSFSMLDAPESPVVALPTPSLIANAGTLDSTLLAAPIPTATADIESVPQGMFDQNPQDQISRSWILIGVLVLGAIALGYLIFVRGR
jgi:hypothetical protein